MPLSFSMKRLDSIIYSTATHFNGLVERAIAHTRNLSYLCERHSFSLPFCEYSVGPIPNLLGRRGPAAVVGAIVPINVNTVKTVTSGNGAHVGHEVVKTVKPSIAHNNPASPVLRILFIGCQVASPLRSSPCVVLARDLSIPSKAVLRGFLPKSLSLKATAAYLRSGGECIRNNKVVAPAVTSAQPAAFLVQGSGFFFNEQAAKALAHKG